MKTMVFNNASLRNVLGYTLLWWLMAGFFGWALSAQFSALLRSPFHLAVWALCIALPLGFLAYILLAGGKTVTVSDDGLTIELWMSQWFRLHQRQHVRWQDIRGITLRRLPTGRGATTRVDLDTTQGRFMFWSVCFDDRELRKLQDVVRNTLSTR